MAITIGSNYLASQGLQFEGKKIVIARDENGDHVEMETFFSIPFDLVPLSFGKR